MTLVKPPPRKPRLGGPHRPDGSKRTTPSYGARRARNRRRNAIAKQSRRGNR